jgi:hypothetical protein
LHFNIPIYSDQPWLPQGLDTSNHQGDAALSLDAFCDWLPLFEAKLPKLPGGSKSEGEALAANKGYLHALKSSPRRLRKMGMWNDVKHVFFFSEVLMFFVYVEGCGWGSNFEHPVLSEQI